MRETQPRTAAARKTAATPERDKPTRGGSDPMLRGMSFEQGEALLSPVQARPADGGEARPVGAVAAQGLAEPSQAPPHAEAVQKSFGRHDVSGVQAHVGGKAAGAAGAMGAQAYATGNHVAFESQPDLHTAAHEYAHVVQQRAGVSLSGGVGKAGDRYERNADEVASLVTQGRSAEGKLDEMGGGGGVSGPVQKKDTNKPTISAVDGKAIANILQSLKASPKWGALLATYKAATEGGTKPMKGGAEDDIFLEALVFVEGHYSFGEGIDVFTLLDDAKVRRNVMGAIKKAAAPKPPEPEKPKVEMPKAGTFGMVTAETELTKDDGSKVTLPLGDALESLGEADGQLKVKVHSGKEIEGTIDPAVFKSQPRISTDKKTGVTKDFTYQKYVGEAFLGEPSVADVDQGSLGDCFLIAGMGAVAAANSQLIKDAIEDHGDGTYTVTFQELQKDGKTFKPHKETVDNFLPTRQGPGANRTAYAQSDTAYNKDKTALWPAIIEKAYAQWKGGYKAIQKGGQSAKAMESITGVKSVRAAMPKEEDVIAQFKKFQDDGKAVTCGTRDWVQQTSQAGLLKGAGDGPFTGHLKDKENHNAEVVSGTVRIRDSEGKAASVRDDSKGALTGATVDVGEIGYEDGAVRLGYDKDKGPASEEHLVASYRYEGTLTHALNIHGNHAYIFRGVKDDTLLFHNPWGPAAHKHPKPVTAAQFREHFETIGVNATPPVKKRS